MSNQKTNELKKQVVQLEQNEKELFRKAKSKRLTRILGIILLLIGFIVLVLNKGESMAFIRIGFILGLIGLIMCIVGLLGLTVNKKLKSITQEIIDIKNEIIDSEKS